MLPDPPEEIRLKLEEVLDLLGALEDARDALLSTNHLVEVATVEHQLDRMNRRLGLSGDGGSDDGD